MKKFALAICLVAAFSSAAYASNVTFVDGSVSGSTTWTNGVQSAENQGSLSLNLSGSASGDGWSVSAKTAGVGNVLDDWSASAKDGKFQFDAWGKGKWVSDKGTPFGWVYADGGPEAYKLRGAYAPVTVDFQSADNSLFVFAEQAVSGATIGGAVKRIGEATNQTIIDGYAKGKAANIDLTGEFAIQPTTEKDNTKLGVKASMPVAAGIVATAQYTAKAKNVDDETKIYVSGEQAKTNTDFIGEFWTANTAAGAKKEQAIVATAKYRATTEKSFDDAVKTDKYYAMTGLAGQAQYKSVSDTSAKGYSVITLKATTPIIPKKAWVLGWLVINQDNDGGKKVSVTPLAGAAFDLGDASTTSNTNLDLYARYLVNSKITVDSQLSMKSAGDGSYTLLGVKPAYQIVSNVKLYGEYWQDSSAKLVKGNNKVVLGVSASF